MALATGARLGVYEIVGTLGAGGMGEVYRARDTKLGRDVAIKVLPSSLTSDPERLARFQREAQVLAALNHPNIATIHHVEEAGDGPAIVMELVEGETLAERIARGPIPVEEALPIAKQIAEALEAAHEQGIIHRDLKPANIKLAPNGTVKVLDFGLAKLHEPGSTIGDPGSAPAALSLSPTITSPTLVTGVGVLLGTAAYMSPEQAKGRSADKRSDIWAFGCALYEMLTGRRPFEGDDVTDTLAAVLRADPDWTRLPPDTPPLVGAMIRDCLVKDPRRRVADVAAIQFALTHAQSPCDRQAPHRQQRQHLWKRLMVPAGVLAVGAAVAAAGVIVLAPHPVLQPVARLAVVLPAGAPAAVDAIDGSFAVAADGSKILYTSASLPMYTGADTRLFLRSLDRLEPSLLAGPGVIRQPFFSPDGKWVAFFDSSRLMKMAVTGGPAIPIVNGGAGVRGASWGPEDSIVYATSDQSTGLLQVSATGGESKVLTRPNLQKGERDHFWPRYLPGRKVVLFTIVSTEAVENAQIAVLDLQSGRQKVILNGGTDAQYVEGGYLVYGNSGTLRAVAFDLNRLEVIGTPVPVVQDVVTSPQGAANFGVTAGGTLAYVSGKPTNTANRTLVWVDRNGREAPLNVPPRGYAYVQLSPDGSRLALDVRDQQNDIWIWDLARSTLQRLTFDPGLNRHAIWTPDGARVAFSRQVAGSEEVYWEAADGSGMPEALTTASKGERNPADIAPDGQLMLYTPAAPPYDIWLVNLKDRPGVGMPLLAGPANETAPAISPDGRWLAYQSDESGRYEIYVRPFPDVNAGRWQISGGGGTRPQWRRDGRELFYLGTDGANLGVMAVAISGAKNFAAATPVTLFKGNYLTPQAGRDSYAVSPDGKRFVMIKDADAASPERPIWPQVVLVQNWLQEWKRIAEKP